MTSRLSAVLTAVVLVLGAGAAFAIAQQVTGNAAQNQQPAAQQQYSGKACGNPNREQGVPPGNPANDDCPPQASQRPNPRRVTSRVKKKKTRRGLRIATSGQVQLPNGLTAAQACGQGRVQIQIKAGARTISTRRVNLRRDCRFRSTVNISKRRVGSRRLVIIAQFLGSDVLGPRRAAKKTVSPR